MKNATKKIIFNILEKILPEMWFISLWQQYIKYNPAYAESIHQYGYFLSKRKSAERYCILRYPCLFHGIGAVMKHTLLQCEWAVHNHMIPVIDFELDYYLSEDMIGRDNRWEYVFTPNASLQDIVEKSNNMYVFVGTIGALYADKVTKRELGLKDSRLTFVKENWREYYKKLNELSKKWWRLQDDVAARYEECFSKLFHPEMKVLGVILREEFSINAEKENIDILKNHPHHLGIDEMIQLIKEYRDRWECTHIFVSTIHEDSIIRFKKEFGEELLYTDRRRVPFSQYYEIKKYVTKEYENDNKRKEFVSWLNSEDERAKLYNFSNKNDIIEYLEEIYGLSLCDYMLAGKSGGALCACIWNGGQYRELEILPDPNQSEYY